VKQISIKQPPVQNKLYNKTIDTLCMKTGERKFAKKKLTPLKDPKRCPTA